MACAVVACCVALSAGATDARDARLLHAMFQDHAVLQRDQPIRIWGQAQPQQEVRVTLANRRVRARADADGRWKASIPALKAGGPYALSVVAGDATRTLRDVLVGDVWLCSGQSNMELPVWRSLDARAEIADASADSIRLFTVPQVGSTVPRETFGTPATWQIVTPETLRDFSAACFYFARELQKTIDVPMGLVSAAWGGSRIEAWMSDEALRATGGQGEALDVLAAYAEDPVAAAAAWGDLWARWWRGRDGAQVGDEPWLPSHPVRAGWRNAPPQLGAWERWGVPEMATFDGMVWYRATARLTARQAAQDAVLLLGPADEMDTTWVNGRGVGSTYGAGTPREYPLPAGLLRAGENVVVVNVLDTWREGGLSGPASAHALRFADGSTVTLGGWRYRVVPGEASPPRAPWQTASGLSTLHNGMIAPLGRYGLRGVAWYQGESNTGEGGRYADLLRGLRSDLRARFGADLPLLVVQLANFGAPPTAPIESGWADVREAQRQVAAEDARTALAVAIDIGDRYDIHPPNKQELGRRLARAALHAAYGRRGAASGPVPRSATHEGEAVRVVFADVTDGLVAHGGEGPIGFELCGVGRGTCRYATAELQGNAVLLRGRGMAGATRVRHGWADGPVVTLFDGAGLPAGPFEIEVGP
ncbi:9-O-acetylesterase [Luteimonas aestuarii]|uniref:9-O-acetylesterase n=1 Tax=Luteimonas aestuarii TaxID=453837 RepID=A0A4R5U4T1_9GAMM|nr:sialate O-acetylesterase [Luteimonas aestuarii]TDK28782.1 9-O-acetylesterase [Luteimonas aestuarii]